MGTIGELFGQAAAAAPERIAVAAGELRLTYRELDRLSDRVAQCLAERRSSERDPITLLLDHGAGSVAAMLGAIKAGRVSVPVDARDPVERLRQLHALGGALVVVTGSEQLDLAAQIAPAADVVVVDELPPRSSSVSAGVTDLDEPAVVYFTSGSTGQPKGVVHSRGNEAHNATSFAEAHDLVPADRIGLTGSFAFAASSARMFGALVAGSTLCTYDLRESGAGALAHWVSENEITVLSLVPSVLRALCDAAPDVRMESVRLVLSGGEALLGRDVKRARHLFGPEVTFCNRLASTETFVIAEHAVRAADVDDDGPVPCGRPVHWFDVEVVGPDGAPAAPDESGELVVIGRHLALGYLNDPVLTAERFFDTSDGRRGYRSADVVRRLADGTIEHLGRLDGRVKVRGAMVSIQEVEAALTDCADVAEAVIVGNNVEGGTRLVAYVVPEGGAAPAPRDLRRELAGRLASYLVPGQFVLVAELPRTTRGKVDRSALPPPRSERPAYRPPKSPRGQGTAEIFEHVLGVDRVGLDDDFFELGGDSLAAVELLAALSERFGVDLPVSSLLEHSTVEELSARLLHGRGQHAPTVLQVHRGSKRPFFCVCGGGATALALHWLAQSIDPDRPLYAVQARGLDERARPDRTVEAAAQRHLEEIRTIQPEGPYLLGGHSFGGVIAYEMARALRAADEEVAILVLIDTDAPPGRGAAVKRAVSNLAPRRIASRVRLRMALVTAGIRPRGHDRQYRLFYGLAGRLGDRYRPSGVFDGRTLLVRRSTRAGDPGDLGWSWLLAERPEIVDVPGRHEEMLRLPHVRELAAVLDAQFDVVDARETRSLSSRDRASTPPRSRLADRLHQ